MRDVVEKAWVDAVDELYRRQREADDTPRPQTPAPPGSTGDEPTPEMIEAGVDAIKGYHFDIGDAEQRVQEIYRAMRAAK